MLIPIILHRNSAVLAFQGSLMPIGEFGVAPPVAADDGLTLTTPLYWMYELAQASLNPARAMADATRLFFQNPAQPALAYRVRQVRWRRQPNCSSARRASTASRNGLSPRPRSAACACRSRLVSVWEQPFCRLLHFERALLRVPPRVLSRRVLIVAPMSGHYATLLRGTVEAFLP